MGYPTCVPKKAKPLRVSFVLILIGILCYFCMFPSYVERKTCSCKKQVQHAYINTLRSSNVATSFGNSSSGLLRKDSVVHYPLQTISLEKQHGNSSVHSASHHPGQNQVNHLSVSPHNEPGYSFAPHLPAHFHYLSREEIKGIETFVFFVGYGRSGHSIVASMMDAHPNVIIAHEYYLFDKLASKDRLQTKGDLFNALYLSSYICTTDGVSAPKQTFKGYNLHLNGMWQGQFQKLRVIGDKTAGSTATMYYKSPALFKKTFKNLQDIVGVLLQQIHVVRNPYDIIATVALYHATSDPGHKKVKASVDNPLNSSKYMAFAVDLVLNRASAMESMARDYNLHPLEIHLEDLIKDTRTIVTQVCQFIGVPCMEEFVNSCQNKVYHHAFRSRELVVWPRAMLRRVEKATKEIDFFNRYSFLGE